MLAHAIAEQETKESAAEDLASPINLNRA